MDTGLTDARVLVAASSGGLGAATARRFALEGARVAINGRDAERLQATAAALRRETGGEIVALPGDVADPVAARDLVVDAVARLGGLDVLVTNAGGPPPGRFETLPLDAWEQGFQLTMMSAVRLIHHALPHLLKSERAAILTITSIAVKEPLENLILSNSVRMAVIGLTKSLAQELGPQGVRVNSILPGWTRTDRVTQLMTERAEALGIAVDDAIARHMQHNPLRRMAEPDEFANVAVFLCSPLASYVNGTMVPVDGGALRSSL